MSAILAVWVSSSCLFQTEAVYSRGVVAKEKVGKFFLQKCNVKQRYAYWGFVKL